MKSPLGESRSGTPEGVLPPPIPFAARGGGSGWGQRRNGSCGGCKSTPPGVLLPFFLPSFVLRRVVERKRNPPNDAVGYAAFAANPPYSLPHPIVMHPADPLPDFV